MNRIKISHKAQKIWASVLHFIFACIALTGVGMLYANPNFGRGINHIGDIAYEDTEEFNTKAEDALEDIFTYIKYTDMFGTEGDVEIDQVVLRMTFGPDDTEEMTIADILRYLKDKGYEIDGSFVCTKTFFSLPASGPASDESGYLEWSILYPNMDMSFKDKDVARVDKEQACVAIMDLLHSYSTAYSQLMSNNSNMHFKIEYCDSESGQSVTYSNDKELTAENVKNFGRYASISGTSVFYDTNFSGIALNTITSLSSSNPYEGNNYYLLVGIDTNYPVEDTFSKGKETYIRNQYFYLLGGVLLVAGGIMTFLTLIYLVLTTGRGGRNGRQVTLSAFDRTSTETCILGGAVATLAAWKFLPLITKRILHPLIQSDLWFLTDRIVGILIIYVCVILIFLSLVRRFYGGQIKKRSILVRGTAAFRRQINTGTPMMRTAVGYFGHVFVNTVVITSAWFVCSGDYFFGMYKFGLLAAILAFFVISNLWGFYMRYRRAVMRNLLKEGVAHLKDGDTSYKIDTAEFDGPEYELAVNINNVGSGLETALNEKVRSERLKADLITNVSHDIKTPLTSIINYVDLMKREKPENPKTAHYLEVLEQKSLRLKILIEDLVEASKASSGNLKLEMTTLELGEMVDQTNGEFEEKFAERGLKIIMGDADRPLPVYADGRRLWRVLENLYNNTFKYALQDSRVYVNCEYLQNDSGEYAQFTIKNISDKPLNISPEELTERFVRGDVSRTTEGSGLGLSIAKSLTELMGGHFEIVIDGDLFKGVVRFPLVNNGGEHA